MENSLSNNLSVLTSVPRQSEQVLGLVERPPVVVVMGHVDHGKTTLLDAIRETNVVGKEAGGITQSIGAYEVAHNGKKITFIDTPGHEAFFAMRSHGVKIADVALLVVAADDGVKPQTKEAIQHILDSKIPFIAVVNKIDKPGVVLDKVKKDLSDAGVLIEEWGGKIPLALVSAKNKEGLAELLDLILLVVELEELKYNPQAQGRGYVIESHSDSRRGGTATVIVTDGVLKKGDTVVCGNVFGSIKALENDSAKAIDEAQPSQPVAVLGLSDLPMVGEEFLVAAPGENVEALAREHAQKHLEFLSGLKLEPQGQPKIMPLIIKTSTQGCVEALLMVLRSIKSEKIGLKLLKCEVGDIVQADIKQAETTGAKIFGFKVKTGKDVLSYADQKNIAVKTFDVIYNFVEEVRKAMTELLDPEITRNEIGQIEILAIFKTEKPRMVVGGKIVSGKLKKGAKFEIQRKGEAAGLGKIVGLQKAKEPQDEVREGNEAGLQIESDVVIEVGDILMAFEEEKKYPEL